MVPLNGTLFFTAEVAVRLLFHPCDVPLCCEQRGVFQTHVHL